MQIAATSLPPAVFAGRTQEAKEAPGPDRDGDADDKSAAATSMNAGVTAAGAGRSINMIA